ncbi:MAG: TerC family protein, partial [Shewanella sp.]
IVDFKIPTAMSLGVTFGLLLAGVLFSLWKTRSQTTEQ